MSIPKYKKIYDHIVKLILTDEWPVGSNMKSENELINFFYVFSKKIYCWINKWSFERLDNYEIR